MVPPEKALRRALGSAGADGESELSPVYFLTKTHCQPPAAFIPGLVHKLSFLH